jgi:hypothetical protein
MSIECGECERDLRGGHAPDCSRNKGPGSQDRYYGADMEDHPAGCPGHETKPSQNQTVDARWLEALTKQHLGREGFTAYRLASATGLDYMQESKISIWEDVPGSVQNGWRESMFRAFRRAMSGTTNPPEAGRLAYQDYYENQQGRDRHGNHLDIWDRMKPEAKTCWTAAARRMISICEWLMSQLPS